MEKISEKKKILRAQSYSSPPLFSACLKVLRDTLEELINKTKEDINLYIETLNKDEKRNQKQKGSILENIE
jgi:predicted RNase H-like HicB family nuclease